MTPLSPDSQTANDSLETMHAERGMDTNSNTPEAKHDDACQTGLESQITCHVPSLQFGAS